MLRTNRMKQRIISSRVLSFALVVFALLAVAANSLGNEYATIGEVSFEYGGVPFAFSHLLGAGKGDGVFIPEASLDIRPYATGEVQRLHMLVSAAYAVNSPNGTHAADVRLRYADGSTDAFPLVMGSNIAEWAYDRPENQECLAHAKITPAYSWWTNQDSQYWYWGHLFYVSVEVADKTLHYVELVADPDSYQQLECPDGNQPYGLGVGVNAMTLEVLSPEVTNVTAVQRTDGSKKVDIYYNLAYSDAQTLNVSVKASSDGGVSYDVNISSVTGDVGSNVSRGTAKHIVWDCAEDLEGGTYGTNYKVCVTADDGIGQP